MAPITLGYWDLRGLGQPIRLLLEYAGADWVETIYTMGPAPEYDQSSWFDVKETLGLDFPNLPYMVDGNVKISQSQTILRYLARKFNLLGTTEEEKTRADLLQAEWQDAVQAWAGLCYSPDFAEKKGEYLSTTLPGKLKRFSAFLGDRPFFAGKNITFADFLVYEFFDQQKLLEPTCLKNYKNLEAYQDRIEKLERIAAYRKSPKFIKYPLFGKRATYGG